MVVMKNQNLPKQFFGCLWNDHWEYDAPCVVYRPWKFRRYGYGGNSGAIDELVESICTDIELGREPRDGGLEGECKWRGWSLRGFSRRKDAWHRIVPVTWKISADGQLDFRIGKAREQRGPFLLNNAINKSHEI